MAAKRTAPPKDRFVFILAGGRGERFWPLSREATPKQLLALFSRKSLLQETVERIKGVVPSKNVFVITNESQASAVRKQLPKLPKDNVIAEPCGRNTCPAVALATAIAKRTRRISLPQLVCFRPIRLRRHPRAFVFMREVARIRRLWPGSSAG